MLATQALGAERFEAFNVFWAAFFLLSGIVQGLMHETTRGVRAACSTSQTVSDMSAAAATEDDAELPGIATATPAKLILPIATLLMLILGVSTPLWAASVFTGSDSTLPCVLLVLATGSFVLQSIVGGLLSGTESWNDYAVMVGFEAVFRLIAAVGAFVAGGSVAAFYVVTVAGIITTPLMLICMPRVGKLLSIRTDVGRAAFMRRSAVAMVAASAATVLVVGFPVLLRITHPAADPALVSNLLLAVLLTRAPILVPLQAFQNAIVVRFVNRREQGRRAVLPVIAAIAGVGIVGAAAAWLIGPWIFGLMGSGFSIRGDVLAALTFASAITGALFVSGAATLACERHSQYVTGWWLATVGCLAVLIAIPNTQDAVVYSLYLGPIIGVLWHVIFGLRSANDPVVAQDSADSL